MRIGGHGLGDHIRFLTPLFVLIAAVWALRLILFAAGAPAHSVVLYIVSVTLAGAACKFLVGIITYTRRFGSYTNIVVSVFLLSCWEQLLISAAILFTILTGLMNVYSAPEFSFGENQWLHLAGHLLFGIGSGTIFGTVVGGLVFWMLRKADRIHEGRAVGGR